MYLDFPTGGQMGRHIVGR